MPVSVKLVADQLDSALPGAGFFLHALIYGIFYLAGAAVLIYIVREGWARRAWWFWPGATLMIVALGPSNAHSVREFVIGWVMNLLALAVTAAVLIYFFRDNLLAYVGAALVLPVIQSAVDLFRQPLGFYRWNGLILTALMVIVLAWMLFPRAKAETGVL